jgi:hypothetical protein
MGGVNKKGGYLVAWKHACHSKADGGLGIIDLRVHNNALLMKFLHKFYNRADLPWVHLTWNHLYRTSKPPPMKGRMLDPSGGVTSCHWLHSLFKYLNAQ